MFPWCRSVNVYNIENHYHFYAQNKGAWQSNSNGVFTKLKPAPIAVTRGNSLARNSKSKTKKGLNLYKNLDSIFNPEQSRQQINTPRQKNSQVFHNDNHVQHGRSATWVEIESRKTRQQEHEGQLMYKTKPQSISTQTQTIVNMQYEPSVSHQIGYKFKPVLFNSKQHISPIKFLKEQNNLLLTNLYSTQSHSNYLAKTCSNRVQNTGVLQQPDVQPISNKSDVMELTTSRNLCSREKSQNSIIEVAQKNMSISSSGSHSRYQESTSGYGYNNSRYNASKSLSASVIAATNNEGFYFRIMEQSRGEAREASIILSNILSRASENCYSSMHLTPNRNRLPADKRMLFEDKQTILSHENDISSDSEIKVEESELNDMDPRNNFIIIPDKTIQSNTYTVSLAIENLMKCLVSLKEVSFREMSDISQELQMYEFIQHLTHTDGYHNVLQLYQVQMAGSSYILIKQPYTCSLISFLSTLSEERVTVLSEFHQILTDLLHQLARHMLYPWRMLNLKDFVVCGGCIIKLHDLSVFHAMNQPIFEISFLIEKLHQEEIKIMNGQ